MPFCGLITHFFGGKFVSEVKMGFSNKDQPWLTVISCKGPWLRKYKGDLVHNDQGTFVDGGISYLLDKLTS